MEIKTIKHALGEWTVIIHAPQSEAPADCIEMTSICAKGFPSAGHAVAYIKRVAKHTPDSSSEFHVTSFREGNFRVFVRSAR